MSPMERLAAGLRGKRAQLVMFSIALFFILAQFLAPLMLEPGTVRDLDARANYVDHNDQWRELPPFQAAIYWFGDLNCHQISNRSFYINGNQMPMCTRDVGLFIGVSLGFMLMLFATPTWSILGTALQVLPRRLKDRLLVRPGPSWTLLALGAACIAPLVLDGTIQLVTNYESNNLKRLLTGIPAGAFMAILIASVILVTINLPTTLPPQGRERTEE